MIGLVDYDLQISTSDKLLIPNIEIMKLATYYRREENLFCRLIDLDEKDLTNYDKIYFFSEINKNPTIPENFLRAKNVVYGGTAFTNGIYIPFDNPIIDYTLPKPFIYKEYLKEKYQQGVQTKVIGHVLDDTYYRCYAGDKKLPCPAINPRKRVFLYDYNLFYPDWSEIIDKISDNKPSAIFCIHPVECKTLGQYFEIRNKPKIARTNIIILNIDIPADDIYYMFKKYTNLFLADINQSSNICLSLGNNFKTSFQYYKDFIYKLNLLYSFWSHNIPMRIKYIEPNIGYNDIMAPLSKLVEQWTQNLQHKQTLNQRMTRKKVITEEQQSRDLLLKFHPYASDLFNQTYEGISTRRRWDI